MTERRRADKMSGATSSALKSPSIRVVLTDVHMPGSMDGVRLAHYVRERFPPTILIVASGAAKLTAADLPERTMFIAKPFDLHYVLQEIERLGSTV